MVQLHLSLRMVLTSTPQKPFEIKNRLMQICKGYKVNINDIRETTVPATTVCALYHLTNIEEGNKQGNESDFGIRKEKVDSSNGEDTFIYYSNAMIFNGGVCDEEIIGICQQFSTTGTMRDQCHIKHEYKTQAMNKKEARKLSTGAPLESIIQHIGKLTFMQPHAHGMYLENGVNIYKNLSGVYLISPDTGHYCIRDNGDRGEDTVHTEESKGIIPKKILYEEPVYNVVLNTKDMIEHQSEFVSTIQYGTKDYKGISGWIKNPPGNKSSYIEKLDETYTMRTFNGLTGEKITWLNERLLETMKSVYAYNPDYDQFPVNAGDVSVKDYNIKFTSNIVSTNASFEFSDGKILNDYIGICGIRVSNYLENLKIFSKDISGSGISITDQNNQLLPQLNFTPSYKFCGEQGSSYLVTSLTYSVPAPKEIEEQLSFKSTSGIIVRKHEADMVFLDGNINKRALYGLTEDNKHLVQLDVSNYKIWQFGKLTLTGTYTDDDPTVISTPKTLGPDKILFYAKDLTYSSSKYIISPL